LGPELHKEECPRELSVKYRSVSDQAAEQNVGAYRRTYGMKKVKTSKE